MNYKHHKEKLITESKFYIYICIVLVYVVELAQVLLTETVEKYFYQGTVKNLQRIMNNG